MSTIVDESGTPTQTWTTTAHEAGISVVAFSEQQLDDALRTVYTMYDVGHNIDTHGQQQNTARHGHKIVSPRRPPTRLETGIRLFNTVPASKVLEFFIALLRHAMTNSRREEASRSIFKDGLGVEHVLVQSFFVWLENVEKRYRKGLPPMTTTAAPNTAMPTTASSSSAKVQREKNNDCDGFRPSLRTPSPPRKGGGRPKQRRQAVAEKQQQKQCQHSTAPPHQPQAVQGDQQQQKRREQKDATDKDTVENKNEEVKEQNINNITAESNSVTDSSPQLYRVLITSSHRDQIITLLASLCFPPRIHSNIWKMAVSVLELKHAKHLTNFVANVKKFVHQGSIGFDLINFCLQHFADKMHFTSNHLVHALLLGPLYAATVDQFVANQSEEFRAHARAVLLEAETWKYDEKKWRDAASIYAHRSYQQLPDFKEFCTNVTTLMNELRNEISDQETLVDSRWAHSLIKTAARKLYTEKTWKEEHFNDLVHSVLAQRPTLKAFLLNVLLKDHNDKRAHEKWRNFVSSDRCRMSNTFDMVNLCSKDEQSQFLSLPRKCAVYEINTMQAFRTFEHQLDEYFLKKTRPVVVGVDAEWNPYVGRSRASLLQLALIHSVYLLDLDALHADKSFQQFIDRLFLNKSVTKLGYQFGDDLAMLRARLPNCIGLFRPQGIVCIGQLVEELKRRSVPHLPDFPLQKFLLPITDQQEEELKDHTRQIKPQRYDAAATNTSSSSRLPVMNPLDDTFVIQQRPGSANYDIYDPYDDEVELYAGHDAQGKVRRMSKKKRQGTAIFTPLGQHSLADQGLAYLCLRLLGKPLDKQEQCSVWDRRPLRRRQVRYAALDANCLMQIHNRCADWSEQLGLGRDPITLMLSPANSQRFYAPFPLFCVFTVPTELLLTTTTANATDDGKVWGNEVDEPEGWTGI